jgi:hypothetical protein
MWKIISLACLLTLLTTSGCVTPPQESTSGPVDLYQPNQFTTEPTGSSRFVTEATPFVTTAEETLAYNRFATPTLPPEDVSCLIYFTKFDWTFNPNKTAFAFDLKNPPMYINYTITKPFNITEKKTVTDKAGVDRLITYEYPSPYSYLEITARDKNTGEILMQDGYGKKYSYYTNNTDIKITQSRDLLIEISGYNVTGAVGFWAKPVGNFDSNTSFNNTECIHWVRSGQM